MYDVRMHYSKFFEKISKFVLPKIMSDDSIINIQNSSDFETLKTTYHFDRNHTNEIEMLIKQLVSNSAFDKAIYSPEIRNAVLMRIIMLTGIFDGGYITSYITVPSKISDTIPLILIDLWDSCHTLVAQELEID